MNKRFCNSKLLLAYTLFCLLLASGLNAQGFIQHYPYAAGQSDGTKLVFPRADGSFRMTATQLLDVEKNIRLSWRDVDAQGQLIGADTITRSNPPFSSYYLFENGDYLRAIYDSTVVSVQHFTATNNLVWSTSLTFPNFVEIFVVDVRANDAGEVFLHGSSMAIDSGFIAKFTSNGDLLWQTPTHSEPGGLVTRNLEPTPDGGCQFVNFYDSSPTKISERVEHYAADGTLQWTYLPDGYLIYSYASSRALSVNPLGESLVIVHKQNDTLGTDSLILVKIAANGQVLDETNASEVLNELHLSASLSFPTTDGGWVVAAGRYIQNNWRQYILRVDASGDIVWYKLLNFLPGFDLAKFTDGHELSDGSLVVYGFLQNEAFLIKMGADGTIYPHTVIGQVARDSTFDCLPSPSDPPLPGWVVTAEKNGQIHFASTDDNGQYTITDLDTGSYQISVVPKNYLWQACVDSVLLTYTDTLPKTDTVNFQIQPLYDCPIMQIDLGSLGLRPCLPATYTAAYCNIGNQSSDSVTVTIQLDPLFQVDSASIPYTQVDNLLTFALGTVAADDCGSIQVYGTVSCEAELGQTLCAEAHITPDTICASNLPNWSGAAVEVTAHCVGDSVQFSILNTGYGANSNDLDFIVIDDHVITRQSHFNLPAGAIYSESYPADGSTWRLVAYQEPGYPFGQQMPSVAVEGCNSVGSGFTTGMVNLFSSYSGDPFNDIDCRVVTGSFDPNDKQAVPIGVDNQHFIDQNQRIDYQIRFQNTGTDTAFTVVIKDTLSAFLNPASVRPGASSHPYTWTLSGAGVLTVTFDNILLPDSNTNEAASHGFVQFRIDQKLNNHFGSVITNRAGIYFDFNAPVMTNTIWHTIGQDFLPVATTEPATAPLLRVWPNPASQTSTVWMDRAFEQGQQLLLRDAFGRIVQEMAVQGPSVQLRRNNLPAGLYFLELRNSKGVLGLGKVVWE